MNRAVPVKALSIAFVISANTVLNNAYVGKVVDNADGSTMLDKRYVITNGNQLAIQNDLLQSFQKR